MLSSLLVVVLVMLGLRWIIRIRPEGGTATACCWPRTDAWRKNTVRSGDGWPVYYLRCMFRLAIKHNYLDRFFDRQHRGETESQLLFCTILLAHMSESEKLLWLRALRRCVCRDRWRTHLCIMSCCLSRYSFLFHMWQINRRRKCTLHSWLW